MEQNCAALAEMYEVVKSRKGIHPGRQLHLLSL